MDRRRAGFIFAAAWVSAALLSWFLYRTVRAPQREATVTVLALNRNMIAGTLVTDADLKVVAVREREAPKGVLRRKEDAVNRALLVEGSVNEVLLDQKLARQGGIEGIAATIDEGMRAVAVRIDSVSGAGDLVQPQARVDVLFTKTGKMSEALTNTILQNVKVLSVGTRVRPGEKIDPKAPKAGVVTLLVSPEEAQKLELAKNEGRISLVLRNPGDSRTLAKTDPVTSEVLDPLGDRPAPKRAKVAAAPAKPQPPLEWNPPPDMTVKKKPDAVVDVFRGGKHTQEVFR